MKRLLCLISNMNAGGAETYLMKIYRKLDKEQYQMDFCVNVAEKNDYEDEIISLGGYVFRIPARSNDVFEHNRLLTSLIKKQHYKYVMAISSSATAYYDLSVAKKAGAKKCIIRSSNSNLGMGKRSMLIQRLFYTLYNHKADVLLAPSDLAAKNMFGSNFSCDNRFHYLKNGLDLKQFQFSEDERNRVRQEFGISKDILLVGHIGRFNTQKNHVFLVDVFERIHQLNPNTMLMMVGVGNLMDSIKETVDKKGLNNCVIFTGLRMDIPSVLCAMDCFLFPSLFEGMPNTVIEAQATGLPCVISDTITKEANVAGIVSFVSLNSPIDEWINTVNESICYNIDRKKTNIELKNNGYDIKECTARFVDYVF